MVDPSEIGINSQMQQGDYSDHQDQKTTPFNSERQCEKVEPFHECLAPSTSSDEGPTHQEDLEKFLVFFPKVCLDLFLKSCVKSAVNDHEFLAAKDIDETQ